MEGSNQSGLASRLAARTGITASGMLLLTLTVVTLAVYGQVWRFEFITLDDPVYVSTNPHVLSGLTVAGIKWAFNRFYIANWFPLTWLSLMIDGTAYEAWAGGTISPIFCCTWPMCCSCSWFSARRRDKNS